MPSVFGKLVFVPLNPGLHEAIQEGSEKGCVGPIHMPIKTPLFEEVGKKYCRGLTLKKVAGYSLYGLDFLGMREDEGCPFPVPPSSFSYVRASPSGLSLRFSWRLPKFQPP